MAQYAIQGSGTWTLPFHLAATGSFVDENPHANSVLEEITKDCHGNAQFLELREGQLDHSTHLFIDHFPPATWTNPLCREIYFLIGESFRHDDNSRLGRTFFFLIGNWRVR